MNRLFCHPSHRTKSDFQAADPATYILSPKGQRGKYVRRAEAGSRPPDRSGANGSPEAKCESSALSPSSRSITAHDHPAKSKASSEEIMAGAEYGPFPLQKAASGLQWWKIDRASRSIF